MKQVTAKAASALALVLASTQAAATIVTYNVTLSGTQSVPTVASTAFGSATVTVDDVLDTVGVALSFSGLVGGNASAGHIHCCIATSGNAPIVIPFTGFPSSTSGTYSSTFTGVSAANIAGIEAGLAYINIHDSLFPAGEIRGNILAVPESGTYALMALGLGAVAMASRRRKRLARPHE